jgi:predicted secreted protein
MFDDARSKKIVLVAHCLLNQNSISDGTADRASQFAEIVEFLMANHIGMIQMPCPELLCLGLDRGDADGSKQPLLEENARIRELLGEPRPVATLRRKADDLVAQIGEYKAYGFQVLGVIGVDRSPSCGVATTSRGGAETPGKRVFLEVLSETLAEHEITLPMIGTKTHEPETSLEKVRQLVESR